MEWSVLFTEHASLKICNQDMTIFFINEFLITDQNCETKQKIFLWNLLLEWVKWKLFHFLFFTS